MIVKSQWGKNLLGDLEILDNIAEYIRNNVGSQDWLNHIMDISGYVGAGIRWHEQEVIGYLKSKLAN